MVTEILEKINGATQQLAETKTKVDKAQSILEQSQPNLAKNDTRICYFVQISSSLLDAIITYKLTAELFRPEWWKKNFASPPREVDKDRMQILWKNTSVNLLYQSFALTEDTFRQIIRVVKPTACRNGKDNFESIYTCLLKELQVPYDENLFKIYRLARNCQHNNGFYFPTKSEESVDVIYRGQTYHFPYGKKVIYANGLPLLEILEDMAELFLKMCQSPKLAAIDNIEHPNFNNPLHPDSAGNSYF